MSCSVVHPAYPAPDKRRRPAALRTPIALPATKAPSALGSLIANRVSQVEPGRLAAWLTALCGIPSRHTLAPGNADAANWLADELRALGYGDVVLDEFDVAGVKRHNVVCTKVGAKAAEPIIVVCAHYDARAEDLTDPTAVTPGADDNASGTVALLELARLLRAIQTSHTLRFIAFSGEEQGLVGADAYAAAASAAGTQIALVLNLDMIGYPADPTQPAIIIEHDIGNAVAANDATSLSFALQMAQAASDYVPGLSTSLGPIYASDYMPFEAHGYACIGAYDGADASPFYHTGNDTPEKVHLPFWADVVRMVLATIMTLTAVGPESPPVEPGPQPPPLPAPSPALCDPVHLAVCWAECDIEGTLWVKLRFRKR